MITDALIAILTDFLAPMFNALMPHVDVSGFVSASTDAGQTIGGYLITANRIFPVDTMLSILSLFLALLPALAAYMVFQWVWDHLPNIAGFGTG